MAIRAPDGANNRRFDGSKYKVQDGFVALNEFRLHNGFRTAVAHCLLMIFVDMTIFIYMQKIRCLASFFTTL